jgi:hypothetical protein
MAEPPIIPPVVNELEVDNFYGMYDLPSIGARFDPEKHQIKLKMEKMMQDSDQDDVQILPNRAVPELAPPRKLSNMPPADEDSSGSASTVVMMLKDEDKALFRFLNVLAASLTGRVGIQYIFRIDRFKKYTKRRLIAPNKMDLEVDMHEFIDIVNFVLVKTLAQIRAVAESPSVQRIRLLDVIMNDAASQHFSALVTLLWKDTRLDAGTQYQNAYVVSLADEAHRRDMEYFRKLESVPQRDTLFEDKELHRYAFDSESAFDPMDSDLFVTPSHPYLFFLRISMQAMHLHRIDDLKRVLDNVKAVHTTTRKDALKEFVDLKVSQLMGPVFLDSGVYGYKEALTLTTSAVGSLSNVQLLEWMKHDRDAIAFMAHLVATCSNFHSMADGKSDSRLVISQRLRQTMDRLVQWVAFIFRRSQQQQQQ